MGIGPSWRQKHIEVPGESRNKIGTSEGSLSHAAQNKCGLRPGAEHPREWALALGSAAFCAPQQNMIWRSICPDASLQSEELVYRNGE